MNNKFYSVDEFGVRNYKAGFLAFISICFLYLVIALFAVLLLHFESNTIGANITNYADAFWTLQMSASTIGFGDHYPISLGGRTMVTLMFYIGVGLVGFIGAIIAERIFGFADTSIKNRELRQQNAEILASNRVIDQKLDAVTKYIESQTK
jgi:voltage-gated potassium channel